jgi:hypothetical protein
LQKTTVFSIDFFFNFTIVGVFLVYFWCIFGVLSGVFLVYLVYFRCIIWCIFSVFSFTIISIEGYREHQKWEAYNSFTARNKKKGRANLQGQMMRITMRLIANDATTSLLPPPQRGGTADLLLTSVATSHVPQSNDTANMLSSLDMTSLIGSEQISSMRRPKFVMRQFAGDMKKSVKIVRDGDYRFQPPTGTSDELNEPVWLGRIVDIMEVVANKEKIVLVKVWWYFFVHGGTAKSKQKKKLFDSLGDLDDMSTCTPLLPKYKLEDVVNTAIVPAQWILEPVHMATTSNAKLFLHNYLFERHWPSHYFNYVKKTLKLIKELNDD